MLAFIAIMGSIGRDISSSAIWWRDAGTPCKAQLMSLRRRDLGALNMPISWISFLYDIVLVSNELRLYEWWILLLCWICVYVFGYKRGNIELAVIRTRAKRDFWFFEYIIETFSRYELAFYTSPFLWRERNHNGTHERQLEAKQTGSDIVTYLVFPILPAIDWPPNFP